MNKYLIIGLVVLAVVISLGYYQFTQYVKNAQKSSLTDTTFVKEDFTFESKYGGDNKWGYTIKGNLPSPCYTTKVDALVRESYPEQVSVVLTITQPSKDQLCAQVLQEYSYSGQYSASEKATVDFDVKTITQE